MPLPTSLQELDDYIRTLLSNHGIENSINESRWLIAEILDVSVTAMLTSPTMRVDPARVTEILNAAQRRAKGEPLAYILGSVDFRGIEFLVDDRVLVPRPETEGIVEIVIGSLKDFHSATCLEIGVGSGCIAVSLLCEHPTLTMVATDLSAAALEVCESNAKRHGVWDRLELVHCAEAQEITKAGFDWIVSNPPYIAMDDTRVEHSVKAYEPSLALFAAQEGLAVIHKIVEESTRLLCDSGRVIVEHGEGQSKLVSRLFESRGFQTMSHDDCFGVSRFIEAWV